MTLPDPWQAVVLVLATYRLVRLAGWDDFPLAVKVRAWATGEYDSDDDEDDVFYRRPFVAHLLHCPFCIGWWISLAVYGSWLAWPHAVMYGAAPLALSGAVGLIAKNWDA